MFADNVRNVVLFYRSRESEEGSLNPMTEDPNIVPVAYAAEAAMPCVGVQTKPFADIIRLNHRCARGAPRSHRVDDNGNGEQQREGFPIHAVQGD